MTACSKLQLLGSGGTVACALGAHRPPAPPLPHRDGFEQLLLPPELIGPPGRRVAARVNAVGGLVGWLSSRATTIHHITEIRKGLVSER